MEKEELKTLKEIDFMRVPACAKHALRAEAVKWVKKIDDNVFILGRQTGRMIGKKYGSGLIAARQWIMKFFNLTEEDLK